MAEDRKTINPDSDLDLGSAPAPTAQPLKVVPKWVRERKQDTQVLYLTRKLIALAPQLDREEFRPLVRNYARLSMMVERIYAEMRSRAELVDADGEVPNGVDVFRRLISEQRSLAFDLGLSPRSKQTIAVEVIPTLDLQAARRAADEADRKRKRRRARKSSSLRGRVREPETVVGAEGDIESGRN